MRALLIITLNSDSTNNTGTSTHNSIEVKKMVRRLKCVLIISFLESWQCILQWYENEVLVDIPNSNGERQLSAKFDGVIPQNASQRDVYNTYAKEKVKNFLDGYRGKKV